MAFILFFQVKIINCQATYFVQEYSLYINFFNALRCCKHKRYLVILRYNTVPFFEKYHTAHLYLKIFEL